MPEQGRLCLDGGATAELLMNTEAHPDLERWQDHNRRGLGFAAAADWAEAVDAFSKAGAVLSRSAEMEPPHEPMALVLGNLANACFRAGRIEDALGHGQRACALRVALAGEDGMPGARARMDLAVMLATAGRSEEAMALVRRAIKTVEHHVGEDDPNLGVILENAARIALSSGAIANAEPFLLRLHTLLTLHEQPTKTADRLLKRVAEIRDEQSSGIPTEPEAEITSAAGETTSLEPNARTLEFSESPSTAFLHGNWEDQPLREAVVITDILLRTTPSGVRAMPAPEPVGSVIGVPPEAITQRESERPLDDQVSPASSLPVEPQEDAVQEIAESAIEPSPEDQSPPDELHRKRLPIIAITVAVLAVIGGITSWWFFFR